MPAGPSRARVGVACLFALSVCLIALLRLTLAAQVQPSAAQPTFSTSSHAIVVDVIVRDRHGRPVTDLAPDDFTLLEDGVRQPIATVSLSMPGPAANASASSHAGAAARTGDLPPTAAPRVPVSNGGGIIALVFDRLSPDARPAAFKAAQTYIDTLAPDDMAGVFLIDRSLETFQAYTNDRTRLHAAIETVSKRPTSNFRRESYTDGLDTNDVHGDNDPSTPVVAPAESMGRGNGGGEHPDLSIAAGMYNREGLVMRRSKLAFEILSRDAQGTATTHGLMALAHALAILPGRKTLIFMAEALTVPPDVLVAYQNTVAVANRANVSVYVVDCGALRVNSDQLETARRVNGIGNATIYAQENGDAGTLTALEWNEDALRRDPRVMFTHLTRETGGLLISNTNDLASGIRRVDADRRFYYLLTYAPTNTALDGTYRHIAVQVRRPDVDVRARDGYLAVPQLTRLPVLAAEATAIAALGATPRPTTIPIHAATLQFLDAGRRPITAIVVDVPRQGVTHRIDAGGRSFQTDFAIYAQIVDAGGEVVRKASQAYRLSGPAAGRERAQREDVLFYRQPALSPGHYTLDFIVVDALGKQAGSGSQPFDVMAGNRSQPSISSLTIVRRAEQVPATQRNPRNPLDVDGLLLTPHVAGPLHKSTDQTLTFFYTAYPGDRPLSAMLELASGGRTLASVPLKMPAADSSGRIQHLARIPMPDVPPGSYDLRVIVSDGEQRLTRGTAFVLEP